MSNVIVFAEIDDGAITDITLQCVSVARSIADGGGGEVLCCVAGSEVADVAGDLFGYGADKVYVADDARLDGYVANPYTQAISSWIDSANAPLVLFPASTVGNDLAASVASELKLPCALDCDSVQSIDGEVVLKRKEFDRKILTNFAPANDRPVVAALRDGIADVPSADASKSGVVESLDVEGMAIESTAKVLERNVAKKTVNLKDAGIIVAGGAGVGNEDNFQILKELADKLGAEIGATRAVIDAGWLAADHQVGQTGATVRPKLYIACGISGAVQHRVGMSDAEKIVAINIDSNAPIFHVAHYKIVGDLKEVLPKLIKLIG